MQKHLVLIDGHHLLYRAYWAIPRTLKTKAGEQTNMGFGVASMLLNILATEEPDALLFCFDEGDETFRHTEHTEYKEGRAETPDDFYPQVPRVMEMIHAFGVQMISNPKYEADDFLCSYARAAEKEGWRVTVVTGDRDAFQLAGDNIKVSIPHKGYQQAEYLGADEVVAKFGIRPDQVPAYKGLAGDSSDNLKGVQGIGPKGAAELLQKYETLDGIYEHLADIRPALREKLERDKDSAYFCERMAILVCDIDLPLSLEELTLHDLSAQEVISFFHQMEFTLLVRRFQKMLTTDFGKRIFGESADAVIESSDKKSEDQLSLF